VKSNKRRLVPSVLMVGTSRGGVSPPVQSMSESESSEPWSSTNFVVGVVSVNVMERWRVGEVVGLIAGESPR